MIEPNALTDDCRRVARAAADLIADKGYSPTMREIAETVASNPVTVLKHLRTLRTAGVLTWDEGRPRTLRFITTTPTTSAESDIA